MDMHKKQLGFILIITAVLLSMMIFIILYDPYQEANANLIKTCSGDCSNEFTPSLYFSIILVIYILVYGIYLMIRKT